MRLRLAFPSLYLAAYYCLPLQQGTTRAADNNNIYYACLLGCVSGMLVNSCE